MSFITPVHATDNLPAAQRRLGDAIMSQLEKRILDGTVSLWDNAGNTESLKGRSMAISIPLDIPNVGGTFNTEVNCYVKARVCASGWTQCRIRQIDQKTLDFLLVL